MRLSMLLTINLLGACASTPAPYVPPKTVTIVDYIKTDCGAPPERSPVELRIPHWQILEFNGDQMFALSPDEYESLGYSTSEILKGVMELKAEIQYYVDCLDAPVAEPFEPG